MMKFTLLLQVILFLCFTRSVVSFPVSQKARPAMARSSFVSLAAKGFGGSADESPNKKRKKSGTSIAESVSVTASEIPVQLNAGQKALEKMRRQKAEEKDAELRRVRELLQTDNQLREAPATIPEDVAQRMGKRMLPFVGLPLFLGMGAFVSFWYLATYKNMEFQPALVAGSTIGILVVGLLVRTIIMKLFEPPQNFGLMSHTFHLPPAQGITYSVMSASWDPEREGSFLGTEEFKRNVDNIKDGFSRSRENALLREKMSGLSEEELKTALAELDRREASDAKRQQSLQNKLKDELE